VAADEKLIFDLLTGQNNISKDLTTIQTQTKTVEKSLTGLTKEFSNIGGSIAGVTRALSGFGAAAIAAAGAFVGGSIIRAAEEQEDAINALNAALKANGTFSEEASKGLQEFAGELQRTTKFSDDAVLSTISLLQTLAPLTNQGLKQATQAALDLSTAFRIDLDSATRLVGKAATGNIATLAKYGLEIRKGKTDAETFANTLEALSKVQGAANNATNTFSGATAQLSNGFGEVLESLGFIITQNPAVINLIQTTTQAFFRLADSINAVAPVISNVLTNFINFAPTLVRFGLEVLAVVKAIELAKVVFQALSINADLLRARFGGVFTGLLAQVKLAVAGLGSLNIALAASKLAFTALKAAATFGLSIALDLAVTKALELAQNVDILKSGVALVGRGFLFVVESIQSAISSLAGFAKTIGSVPGGPEFLKSISTGADNLEKRSKQIVDDLRKSVDGLNKDAEKAATQRGPAGSGGPLLDPGAGLREAAANAREELAKTIKELEKGLANVGLTQVQIIEKEGAQRLKSVIDAEKAGILTRQRGEVLIEKIRKDQTSRIKKAELEALDARRKKLQENIQIAAQNPLNLAFKDVNFDLPEKFQSAVAGVAGGLTTIAKGAQGAAQFLSSGLGALANAFAPGAGQAVSEVINFLSQGPAKVKETIDAFFQNLPSVLATIVESIPAILQSIGENLAPLVERLIETIPQAVQAFIDRLPEVVVKLIEGALKASVTLATQMPFVAIRLATSLAAEMPKAAISFVDQLVKDAPRFITEMIKAIPGQIGGGIAGAGGGLLGSVTGVLGGIGDVFGFAEGGTVPGGAPFTDRVPALLTPGETVVDRSLTNRLEQFLSAPQQGSGQMVVNLVIGEQQLANVILDLNRRGYRLQ